MGYLHFDRVKIPQENSIFNGSSSIQLSSVNELLKEHGIVLNNNESDAKSSSHSSFPSTNDENTVYNPTNVNTDEVFLQNSLNNENIPLGLDEELTWDFNHNAMFTNKLDANSKNTFELKANVFDNNNFTSSSSHLDSSVLMNVNNVVAKINRKELLDLKVHKALVDIPGFNDIKEKYQCAIHRNGKKKGRGRKMKCCQTADDLFRLALKEKCQSIGIHDYSKLKRRRGRPKKLFLSSPSNVNSTVSSSSTYLSKDFAYHQQNEEPAGSGQSLEHVDQSQSNLSVQFQLNQLQKQLNEQQLLLNEQMKSINFQRTKPGKPSLLDIMNSFVQPHNHDLISEKNKQPSHVAGFQASFASQHNQDAFAFKANHENNMKTSLLQKQSQLGDINSLNFVSSQKPSINTFENMLSPVSLNTPNLLSPGRYSHRSSISNMNNILVNELLNGNIAKVVHSESQNDDILGINERDDKEDDEDRVDMMDDDEDSDDGENYDDGHLLEEFEPKITENKVEEILEIKPKKKYQKKTKTDADKKLTHISGKKIEVDPITNKMKCFHEGCDAQFKQKAYLSRHMKKHLPIKDHVCPFWSEHVHTKKHAYSANFVKSAQQSGSNMNCLGASLPFETKLRQRGLLESISDKSMNKYISSMQCHQKGFFTRKDEFMIHLKSFHVITDLKENPDYAICVECGEEFTSLKDWYENHLNTLSCSKIINKDFNTGRALRKKYEKENRIKRPKKVIQEKTN